jgi:uncharacterized protein
MSRIIWLHSNPNMSLRFVLFDESGTLRSGWRFSVYLAALVLAAILGGEFLGYLIVNNAIEIEPGTPTSFIANSIVMLAAALLVGWICVHYLEGLPFRSLGAWFTRGWARHLMLGLTVGAATLGTAVGIAYLGGGLRFSFNTVAWPEAVASSVIAALVLFGLGAAYEELIFRGYILQTFSRAGLAWLAIVLTSALFAFVHTQNPNAGIISTANTALAGIWFAIAYLKTRDLWFVAGMHFIWNWMQGAIFGIEVSGLKQLVEAPLLNEIDRGPEWLTGGSYGIEAGIGTTAAILISIAAIHFLPFAKADPELVAMTSPDKHRDRQA